MQTVDATPQAVAALAREVPDGEPIVLINLLRYRRRAAVDGDEIIGREAYERYAKALEPVIMAVGGRPIWRGRARFVVIGPPDERWDEVILVAYPDRSAFERMLRTHAYRVSAGLRTAALEDSRLIVATAPQTISRAAWSLYKLAGWVRSTVQERGLRPRRSDSWRCDTTVDFLMRRPHGLPTTLSTEN